MTAPASHQPTARPRSAFAGADICAHTGFELRPGTARPVFDADVWDFIGVVGLPVQMPRSEQTFIFTTIAAPAWRLVAKELIFALLVPGHEAVALLPGAYRSPLSLRTCHHRLEELTRWFAFLAQRGLTSLDQVDDECCLAYAAYRSHRRDRSGRVTGTNGPSRRAVAIQLVLDLVNYRELFADRLSGGLRPWGSATAARAAGRKYAGENATPPVAAQVLQPMLAAALYLTDTIGPHLAELHRQYRADLARRPRVPSLRQAPAQQLADACTRHRHTGEPLVQLTDSDQQQRLAKGWASDDPLLPVSLDALAQQAGTRVFRSSWIPPLRHLLEHTTAQVGYAPAWARNAVTVNRADTGDPTPWTLPLHPTQLVGLVDVITTAALIVVAALSGMRCGELMELRVGCQRTHQTSTGLTRFKLASCLVKGQPLGGTPEEWVVIEPAYHAAGLAEQLTNPQADPQPLLFGRFQFHARYRTFRGFVNGPAGQRLGLTPIPDGSANLRMLRRTLAIELAYRPGGLLAAKVQLKHIATATAEGYAARPGGAQAQLLAEINAHEQDRNLQLVLAEFRNYQQGILPAGPGARELTTFFATVDAQLAVMADTSGPPRVQHSDRDILNLLSKRAKVLHLGMANYCWYVDPAQALCHRLAGSPPENTGAPMANMCDSARCPQATHHQHHRAVWAEHAATTKTFLGTLGPTRTIERARLAADYERAVRICDAIDAAATTTRPATAATDPQEQ